MIFFLEYQVRRTSFINNISNPNHFWKKTPFYYIFVHCLQGIKLSFWNSEFHSKLSFILDTQAKQLKNPTDFDTYSK